MKEEMVTLELALIKATGRAALLSYEDEDPLWVPLSCFGVMSQRDIEDSVGHGALLTLQIAEWKAEQLGWL